MLIFEIIMVAMSAIRANVLRAVLTTLGIIIGVAAVISVVALGEGAQRRVQSQIQRMGTNVLTIRPGTADVRRRAGDFSQRLYVDDAEALKNESRRAADGRAGGELRAAGHLPALELQQPGHGHLARVLRDLRPPPPAGRFFNEGEVQGRRRVAVLGSQCHGGPGRGSTGAMIGQTIQIRGVPFEVVGVLEEKGEAAWIRPDEEIFIPVSTAQYRVFGGRERLSGIYAATATPKELDQAYVGDRPDHAASSTGSGPARRPTSTSATRRTCCPRSTRRTRRSRCSWPASPG